MEGRQPHAKINQQAFFWSSQGVTDSMDASRGQVHVDRDVLAVARRKSEDQIGRAAATREGSQEHTRQLPAPFKTVPGVQTGKKPGACNFPPR